MKAHTRLVMNDREDLIVACAIGDLGWLKRCLKDGFRPAETNSDVSRIIDRQQLTENNKICRNVVVKIVKVLF